MLDIKDIKKRKEYYKECFNKREYEVDLDNLINLYDKQNKMKQEQETLLALKNKGAKDFEIAKRNNADNLEELQANLRANTQKIADLAKEYNEALDEYNKIFYALPNIVVDDTPAGGKENNVVLKEFKEKTKFTFKPKNHIELCKQHNLIDYDRAIKISG